MIWIKDLISTMQEDEEDLYNPTSKQKKYHFPLRENELKTSTLQYYAILGTSMRLLGIHPYDDEKTFLKILNKIVVVLVCMYCFIAFAGGVKHGISLGNFDDAAESMVVGITLLITFLISTLCHAQSDRVRRLCKRMDEEFIWIETATEAQKKLFWQYQRVIKIGCDVWNTLSACLTIFFYVKGCYGIWSAHHNGLPLPLLHKMYIGLFNITASPSFEIHFFLSTYGTVVVFAGLNSFVIFDLVLTAYACYQFDFITMELKGLLKEDTESDVSGVDAAVMYDITMETERATNDTIAMIVTRHCDVMEFCDEISTLMGLIMLVEIVMGSVMLCACALQIAADLEDGKFPWLFLLAFFSTALQLFVSSFIGSVLITKSGEVSDAACGCRWWRGGGHRVAVAMQFISLRSQHVTSISALGFANVSLETFTSIMSTTGSYFTMLRNMMMKQ